MPKVKISEFSSTPANNTDIDSINIAEGCAPSGINDAIRELMAQLKDFQTGAVGDSFNGPVGTTTAAAGAFTTLAASGAVTLSGGTANGVAYLNGSKVVTSGSALTFDGTTLATTGKFGVTGGGSVPTTTALQIGTNGAGTRWLYNVPTGGEHNFTVNGSVISFQTETAHGWYASGSEQMRLTSTGLGIGTSSPAYKVSAVVGSGSDAFFADANNLSYSGYRIRAGVSGQQWAFRGGTNTMGLTDVTAGVDRVVVDLSGNLGLGVTPSAWGSTYKAIQIGNGGSIFGRTNVSRQVAISANMYNNGSGNLYIASEAASQYQQDAGAHYWYQAPSGTAGNAITFTQAMTLDASGNLVIGDTSADTKFNLVGGTARISGTRTSGSFLDVTPSNTGTDGVALGVSYYGSGNYGPLKFTTGGSERARITSSGLFNLSGSGSNTATTGWEGVQTDPVGSIGISRNGSNALAFFHTSNANGLSGTPVGTVSITTTTTSYNTSSDQRLKENIQNADSSSAIIDALQVRKFDWKSDNSHQRYGFVAQELVTVAPEAVHQPEDSEQMMAVDYSKLVPMLVKEVQSLRKRLADAGL